MEKRQAVEFLEYLRQDRNLERTIYGDALNMAIEALKAQLSKEGITSDLISRMETVEHLRRVLDATVPITDYDEGYVDGVEFGISTVSTMPTIQPQSTTGQLNDGAQSTAQSTDLIDRQDAIDAVNNAFDRETLLTGFVRSIAVRAIRDMPSAQLEPQWVPVSERLPEESEYYIITANDGVGHRTTFAKFQKKAKSWDLTGARSYWRVIAWMPLPEPMKG